MAFCLCGALPSPFWEDSLRTLSVLQYKSIPFLISEREGEKRLPTLQKSYHFSRMGPRAIPARGSSPGPHGVIPARGSSPVLSYDF